MFYLDRLFLGLRIMMRETREDGGNGRGGNGRKRSMRRGREKGKVED